MPDHLGAGIKGVLLIVGAYIVAVIIAILIIAISIKFLIDTHNCSAMGPSLLALWCTTAAVFLFSGIAVKTLAWKITPDTAGRLVIMAVYGVAVLVTYVGIAFGLLLAFNC